MVHRISFLYECCHLILLMLRIFLAHAKEDDEAVSLLYKKLKQKGYQPWLDKEDLFPGQNWKTEVRRAIKDSQVVIACLSKCSVAKQGYVQQEFRIALNEYAKKPLNSIYLIPLRLDKCKIPELRQEEYGVTLRDIQWVDFFQADGFNQLVKALEYGFPDLACHSSSSSTSSALGEIQPSAVLKEHLGNGVHLDMIYLPAGRFWMGSPHDEFDGEHEEKPQHAVNLPGFYMGKYPVTQQQWRAVSLMADVRRDLKSVSFSFQGDHLPVDGVSWYEAIEFCQRLSYYTGREYRLPSEAEWEYACRAGTNTSFYNGDALTSALANYAPFNSADADEPKGKYRQKTTAVGSFPANAFGLYDMHGNVWEWCLDFWHSDYLKAPTDGSVWRADGDDRLRVARGGSWFNYLKTCRSSSRTDFNPVFRSFE